MLHIVSILGDIEYTVIHYIITQYWRLTYIQRKHKRKLSTLLKHLREIGAIRVISDSF